MPTSQSNLPTPTSTHSTKISTASSASVPSTGTQELYHLWKAWNEAPPDSLAPKCDFTLSSKKEKGSPRWASVRQNSKSLRNHEESSPKVQPLTQGHAGAMLHILFPTTLDFPTNSLTVGWGSSPTVLEWLPDGQRNTLEFSVGPNTL